MNYELATDTPLTAYETDTVHLAGTVSPQEARGFEMRMWQQPEQQQTQRRQQALGGSAELGMYLDHGPVAFAPFVPHGYHARSLSGHRL